MGFARDLGAAMTFGISVNTKHKEAETKYGNLRKQHERRLNAYNEVQAQVQSSLERLWTPASPRLKKSCCPPAH